MWAVRRHRLWEPWVLLVFLEPQLRDGTLDPRGPNSDSGLAGVQVHLGEIP